MNTFLSTLLSRRSCREYDPRPVDRALLEQVLLAGLNAPSAHDSRPWRFCVLDRPEQHRRLTSRMHARLEADLVRAGVSPAQIQQRLERTRQIFGNAPVLVVGFLSRRQRENPLAPSAQTEHTLGVQSVALAAGQMLLAAHSLGLGGCWFAAPLFCPELVCESCGIDETLWEPQYLLTFGYPRPGSSPKPKQQPTLRDAIFAPPSDEQEVPT